MRNNIKLCLKDENTPEEKRCVSHELKKRHVHVYDIRFDEGERNESKVW